MSNLVWEPTVELAQMIRDRHISAIELLDAHLNQIAQHNFKLNAIICFSDDPSQIRLADLQLREREKFLYEYDFSDRWCHQLRVEAIADPTHPLPAAVCLAGRRATPPEDCGGPWVFLVKWQHYSVGYGLELLADIQANGARTAADRSDEIAYSCNG